MTATPIFTSSELVVLTSVMGGSVFYGFQPEAEIGTQEVLAATNDLVRRGVLAAPEGAYQVSDPELAQLLGPMRSPRTVVFLTPASSEKPQVCYLFDGQSGLGFEAVLVQPDAVRAFPVKGKDWAGEVLERCALGDLEGQGVTAAAREERAEGDDLPMDRLLENCPGAIAGLDYYDPENKRGKKRVVVVDNPGEIKAFVLMDGKRVETNDVLGAIGL